MVGQVNHGSQYRRQIEYRKRPIDDVIDVMGDETVGDKRSGVRNQTPG